jgi:glycerophosphoryl diester phosphodiesterase
MPQFNDHFIQAHRGASGAFPENTMRALVEAAAAGVRSIETDLSLLSDDSFAIFHDSKLGRTVNGDKAISVLDAKSLSEYDAGSWRGSDFAGETIPALMDVLEWQRKTGIGFNWEIKPHIPNSLSNSDIEYRVLCKRHANALSDALKGVNPVLNMVSSYDPGCLAEMKKMMPDIARALIAETLPKDWRNIADELNLEGFHLNHEMLSKEQVEAIHSVGLAIRCYTVNEQVDIDRLVAFGVDTAITDWPERFISLDKPMY